MMVKGSKKNSQRFITLFILTLIYTTAYPLYGKTYSVGVVPQFDIFHIQKVWQPILEELSKKTNTKFVLEATRSIPQFEKEFSVGKFDFAYMNPYHLIIANKTQGYLPLVRDVGKKLNGIIVVLKDSPIQSINDLDGKIVAFPAPNALGAALIPRAEFERLYKIKIIPKYVRSHTSVYLNVILRQASAGGGVERTFNQQQPNIQDGLRVLHRTKSVASHPIAVHPRVPEVDQQMFLKAILEFGETINGRALLGKIPLNQIGKADIADYEDLNKMGLEDFYIKE